MAYASEKLVESLDEGEFHLYIVGSFMRAILRFLLVYALIAAVALCHAWVDGFATSGGTHILVGSGISVLIYLLYSVVGVFLSLNVRMRFWMLAVFFLIFPVYGFTLYIIAFHGVWPLLRLFSSFSLTSLVTGLFYLVLGVYSFIPLTRLTNLGRIAAGHRPQTKDEDDIHDG